MKEKTTEIRNSVLSGMGITLTTENEGILIGKANGKKARIAEGSILSYAAAGKGNAICVELPNIMSVINDSQRGVKRSCIAVDTLKGAPHLFEGVTDRTEMKTCCLDFGNPGRSASWDPLTAVLLSDDREKAADDLAEDIINAAFIKYDVFLPQIRSFIRFLIRFVALSPDYRGVRRLDAIMSVLLDMELDKQTAKKLSGLNAKDPARKYWIRFNGLSKMQRDAVLSKTHDKFLVLSSMKEIFSGNDLACITEEPTLAYVSMPRTPDTMWLVRLFVINTCRNILERKPGSCGIPVTMIVSDLPSYGPITGMDRIMSEGPASGLNVIATAQSPGDIAAVYGKEESARLEDSCKAVIYFGATDTDTAYRISDRAGLKKTLFSKKRMIQPDEALNLPKGREYLFIKGSQPVALDTLPFHKL